MTNNDANFLNKAHKVLGSDKWDNFLENWANALESYGTPRDFVYSTYSERGEVEFRNDVDNGLGRDSFPAVYVFSPNNDQRRELMAKQKDYVPEHPLSDYNLRLDFDNCFLCQNIIQAEDRIDNIISELGKDYIIGPNRYPITFGHSLLVPRNHDDLKARIVPCIDEETGKKISYKPKEGKTNGTIITSDFLYSVIEASRKYDLVAARNHSLDAMSISEHDHWHLFPRNSSTMSLLEGLINADGEKRNDYIRTLSSQNFPFSAMIISGEEKEIIKNAIPLLKRMEDENEVFTLAYWDKHLIVSPRDKLAISRNGNKRIQIGVLPSLYCLPTKDMKFIDNMKKFLPIGESFNWSKFI